MTEEHGPIDAGDRPIWRILYHKAARHLGLSSLPQEPAKDWEGLMKELDAEYGWALPTLVTTPPGSGKSRDATELMAQAWEKRGKKGLYLMLSHDAIKERMAQVRKDGRGEGWAHWEAHEPRCPARWENDEGYPGSGPCDCGRPEFKTDVPTFAPIEYALPMKPGMGRPLLSAVDDFDFWIVDETDLRRFLGYQKADRWDVGIVAETHPDGAVRALASGLGELMDLMNDWGRKRFSGPDLYSALDKVLQQRGNGSLADLVGGLGSAALPDHPWTDGDRRPKNFPPVLVPVLRGEATMVSDELGFNPRVHLVNTGTDVELHVWWRKHYSGHIADGEPVGYWPRPVFILDATADPDLMGKVFPEVESSVVELGRPHWPDNVFVHQWQDDIVTRGTLGIPFRGDLFSPENVGRRQTWYGRISNAITDAGVTPGQCVGIITHMDIEDEAAEELRGHGFPNVCSLHYGDERGSNELEGVRALVLLGLPIPAPEDFEEEAAAFLYDSGPLKFQWQRMEQQLPMRDGEKVPVRVGGYWDEPVASYYRQKCQFGLYQALHRIRPYIPQDYDRHIFIFTNMPVPDVLVDDLLRDHKKVAIDARWLDALGYIDSQLSAHGECLVPDLARGLAAKEGVEGRSVAKWIANNGTSLAEKLGVTYTPGSGKRAGRFATRG